MNIDTDKKFQEHKIEKVEPARDGSWAVTFDSCLTLWVTAEHCKVAPQVGETLRSYGRGFGYEVRGIAINGRVYRYRTEAEAAQDHKDAVAKQKLKKAEDYEGKRADFDARVAALPEPLRLRIERFRAFGENEWRYEFEPYELLTCEQAAAFADALKTVDELKTFSALAYDEQRKRVAAMSDGHSGNTFGQACALASCLITNPELVVKMHGALCPLVGCEAYGCFAGHEARRGIEA